MSLPFRTHGLGPSATWGGHPARPLQREVCPSPPLPALLRMSPCVSPSLPSRKSRGERMSVGQGSGGPRRGSSRGKLPCCRLHTSSSVPERRAEVPVLTPCSVRWPPIPLAADSAPHGRRWARAPRLQRRGIFAKNRREKKSSVSSWPRSVLRSCFSP